MRKRSINTVERIPLVKEDDSKVTAKIRNSNITVGAGQSTLIVFNRDTKFSLDNEVKFAIAHQMGFDTYDKRKNISLYSGIEALHEKPHMELLQSRIKEDTTVNKIVVATAIKGRYNNNYFDRLFDHICHIEI